MTDGHVAHVAHAHRNAILRSDDHVVDVRFVFDQPKAPDVIKLSALRIKAAACIGVVDGKLLNNLRYRDVIAVQARRIEQHLVLHYRAAESGIVGDAANLFVLALDHPVFDRFQLLRRTVRAGEHIAIDQSRRTGQRRKRRLHPGGIGHLA